MIEDFFFYSYYMGEMDPYSNLICGLPADYFFCLMFMEDINSLSIVSIPSTPEDYFFYSNLIRV